jgi:hypothetical protein
MLAYYGILDKVDSHCFRIDATIKSGFYVLFAGTFLLTILSSFVQKASFQHVYDIEAAKKLLALDDYLPLEGALAPIDDELYKAITPPPVLFTDAFRWALRREHPGDRPLEGMILEDVEKREMVLQEKEDENVSSGSLPSYIDVHDVDA